MNKQLPFHYRGGTLQLGDRCLIMGILNVTPDSFSDGNQFFSPDKAVAHARQMIATGADIIDIGGESTRPGASPVDAEEEVKRVVPVIQAITEAKVLISIDTMKASVAKAAIDAGAHIINDVSGLRADSEMARTVAESKAGYIMMHMRGTPKTMQKNLAYDSLTDEIIAYFNEGLEMLASAGVPAKNIMLDPGIGFGKSVEQNVQLIADIARFRAMGFPVLMGPSRKSFIGTLLSIDSPSERILGTAGAVTACAMKGADIVRVHDIKEMKEAVTIADAIRKLEK